MSQCFTQILCTLISNLVVVKVEFSECLYEKDRNERMTKKMMKCCLLGERMGLCVYICVIS